MELRLKLTEHSFDDFLSSATQQLLFLCRGNRSQCGVVPACEEEFEGRDLLGLVDLVSAETWDWPTLLSGSCSKDTPLHTERAFKTHNRHHVGTPFGLPGGFVRLRKGGSVALHEVHDFLGDQGEVT